MLQGARNRLAYLRGEIAIRIIWEAAILAALICELRLKKKIFTFNYARCDRSRHCSPDSFFDIVLTLIRGIESAETGGNRLHRQRLSTVLLPSGTIHYPWRGDAPEISSSGSSHESEYLEGTVGKRPTENELSDFSRLWHDGCGKTIIEAQNVDQNHSAEV